jgi:hypothetical protein
VEDADISARERIQIVVWSALVLAWTITANAWVGAADEKIGPSAAILLLAALGFLGLVGGLVALRAQTSWEIVFVIPARPSGLARSCLGLPRTSSSG